MIEITTEYQGHLRCKNTHGPSLNICETDAPVDNNGRGESFSPTDLVATALASCMATIMGIVAAQKGIDLLGMTITVNKYMSENLPLRISKLDVKIEVPLVESHPQRELLESSAISCPVYHSLNPEIEVSIVWCWQTTS